MKKFILYFSLSFSLSLFLTFLYMFLPKSLESLDNSLRDYFFNIRGEIPDTKSVVIIDIDEKSLKKLGQWPWSRNILAKILENLTNAQASLIGLDIVFAEEDKSSPHMVLKKLHITRKNIPNYDLEFSKMIAKTPTILGYQFEFKEDTKYINKEAPNIPAIFIEKNKKLGEDYLVEASGTILNIPLIQNNSYSSGFFNNIPDISGIIRSVPLIISYNNIIYPSLALEILRIITNTNKVLINYDENGVKNISLNQLDIPTDRYGRLFINFRGGEKSFKYISAVDVYENNINKEEIKDKIVLMGTTATGLYDLRATPFETIFPGIEVHANTIDNMIKGDFIKEKSWYYQIDILIIFFLCFFIIMITTYSPFLFNPIISILSIIFTLTFLYIALFKYGIILNIFFPIATIILATIVVTLFDYFYRIKNEKAIKKKFASKVSKKVMENLLRNVDNKEFQVMSKEVTVFFSDIRDFTEISEKISNEKEFIKYLNEYFEPMSNIITKYEGTIDKYIGDAIMAYWNAPKNVKNHADKALHAALEQLSVLKRLNRKLKRKGQPIIQIGIGLNSGDAIVGEMGSKGRSDYTVIGDSINLGSRIESLCKFYGSQLNITEFTKEKLKEEYVFRYLDLVTVKGKNQAVKIWQVYKKGQAPKKQKKELEEYHQAINLYENSNFKEALKIFRQIKGSDYNSNNKIYDIYIQRCNEFIKNPPKKFNGIYQHQEKK